MNVTFTKEKLSDEACQAFIDRKIPKDLQDDNPAVGFIRAGWHAGQEWRAKSMEIAQVAADGRQEK